MNEQKKKLKRKKEKMNDVIKGNCNDEDKLFFVLIITFFFYDIKYELKKDAMKK